MKSMMKGKEKIKGEISKKRQERKGEDKNEQKTNWLVHILNLVPS